MKTWYSSTLVIKIAETAIVPATISTTVAATTTPDAAACRLLRSQTSCTCLRFEVAYWLQALHVLNARDGCCNHCRNDCSDRRIVIVVLLIHDDGKSRVSRARLTLYECIVIKKTVRTSFAVCSAVARRTETSIQSDNIPTGLTEAVVETRRTTSWIRSTFWYIVLTCVQYCHTDTISCSSKQVITVSCLQLTWMTTALNYKKA